MTVGMRWAVVATLCVIAFMGAAGGVAAWSNSAKNKPSADCGAAGVHNTYHTDAISLVVVCNNGKVYEP